MPEDLTPKEAAEKAKEFRADAAELREEGSTWLADGFDSVADKLEGK